MRRLNRKQREAAGIIAAVVTLIGVMMAVIIGAIVFFAFADSGADQITDTHDVVNASRHQYVDLRSVPGDSPRWNITKVNNTGVTSHIITGYTYQSGNNTLQINEAQLHDENDTSATLTITYFGRSGDVVNNVVAYAITIFALLAIIPLVMVGGLMLKSLGFMSGGEMV